MSEVNPVRDELLEYYERELTFLRGMGADFAEKYPKIASRLILEPDRCEDPHVERMLEAFAFLAARVHLKIDDDFPEITESLLGMLYPHYIRPIPSMSSWSFIWIRSRASCPPDLTCRAPRSSIPSRWMVCRANFAPVSTPPCGRFASAKRSGALPSGWILR